MPDTSHLRVFKRGHEDDKLPLIYSHHTRGEKGFVWQGKNEKQKDEPTVSMSRLFSSSADLSLISLLATHVFIWSRRRCNFFIWDFKSVSDFSFWVWFVDPCILSYMLSKSSTPSPTFFRVRSISAIWENLSKDCILEIRITNSVVFVVPLLEEESAKTWQQGTVFAYVKQYCDPAGSSHHYSQLRDLILEGIVIYWVVLVLNNSCRSCLARRIAQWPHNTTDLWRTPEGMREEMVESGCTTLS